MLSDCPVLLRCLLSLAALDLVDFPNLNSLFYLLSWFQDPIITLSVVDLQKQIAVIINIGLTDFRGGDISTILISIMIAWRQGRDNVCRYYLNVHT